MKWTLAAGAALWLMTAAEPPIRLVDTAKEAGLRAEMRCGGAEKKWIVEANGSGCAALDYDQDGWLDLLIVNGATMERLQHILAGSAQKALKDGVYLFRNQGDGRFEDTTAKSGLRNPYWGTGANAADFDNDGWTDILITNIGVDLLFRNNGDGTFVEMGAKAALAQETHWHTGSAFGDYDQDGDLDVYVAGYVHPRALQWSEPAPVCDYRGLKVFCGPLDLRGEPDILYRNNGDGTFTDGTRQAGVFEETPRYGFSAVFEDFNQDGSPDIFVANDSGANYLYLNTGNGRFEEAALVRGLAFNHDGKSMANMGIALGDYDNDGDLDALTTTFSEDYSPLFAQQTPGFFEEVSARAGLVLPTLPLLEWACGFVDFDNDGHRDLWLANGHVYPTAGRLGTTTYEQPLVLLRNSGGQFRPLELEHKGSFRGGCSGDFNNDGRVELAVLPIAGAPLLMMNRSQNGNHWLGITLRSRPEPLGAKVRIEFCGKSRFDTLRNGDGYLSRNDPRLHFGLGNCAVVDRVAVTWPNGQRQEVRGVKVDRYLEIQQPNAK